MLHRIINFFLENKLVAFILLLLICLWGLYHSPYNLGVSFIPKDPISVDAIPDIGENQQIVFTEWEGQSPQEIENQITYPLTSHLLGMSGVKTIRSTSMFGFSSIYVIFDDDIDFYWSRNRIIEKINSLPRNLLPPDVTPTLGPDATAMGQIFWYTLEGRDEKGDVTGGWDLQELRSLQDFYVSNALSATPGISEIASIGGFEKEYQIDLNPELMRQYDITMSGVVKAVRESNLDVGARTLEINKVEYFVRGLGYVRNIRDLEQIPLGGTDYTPILLKDIATVNMGPADRRGILDKGGAEVVGGVAISQYGANPMEVVKGLKESIQRISPGLPSKVLEDGRISKVTIVPFYDRSVLINETLGTLGSTLGFEILITILVVLIMLAQLRISLIVSSLMPIVVLAVFGLMHIFDVDANIVALSGLAIAIGTLVDMGVILTENIVRHLESNSEQGTDKAIFEATKEVSGAIITAGLTTVVSFIPVFTLIGPEGKLFTPLAFTKTAALGVAMVVSILFIPPIASLFFAKKQPSKWINIFYNGLLFVLGIWLMIYWTIAGLGILAIALLKMALVFNKINASMGQRWIKIISIVTILGLLSHYWKPLGSTSGFLLNLGFVSLAAGVIIGGLMIFRAYYERILVWTLENKAQFMLIPVIMVTLGAWIMSTTEKEFMPSLDEGSFLLMPVSMPHAGIAENNTVLKKLDMAVAGLPEIETVVGKAGRVSSALDPAPLSMYENLIVYKPEYIQDAVGKPIRFKTNAEGKFQTKSGEWVSDGGGHSEAELVKSKDGDYYRNWRSHIHSPSQIWSEILKVTHLPGVTTPPKLQPIETRLVMVQTGMRSSMGIKIKGQDLKVIEEFGIELESHISAIEGIEPGSVFADRIVSKPYLELEVDRNKAARYNLSVRQIQEAIEVAVGGKVLAYTVEGRERYGIRVRYPREMRASPEDIGNVFINTDQGSSIPLSEVVIIDYNQGAQMIKSEDSFLVGYVIFDKQGGISEITAVNRVKRSLENLILEGKLKVPEGVTYEFDGNFKNQQRAESRLSIVIPLVLLVIFLILYMQFKSTWMSLMVFSGVAVSFAGGFILLWLYGQTWFMNFGLSDFTFRDVYAMDHINLSVAVWVGFIALFGIATDDGVVMGTYLKDSFTRNQPTDKKGVRAAVLQAGLRRIRPCLMTTATTILALLPILTSSGRGSDVMIAMAIPCMGGMIFALLSLFMVPVLFSWREELKIKN